MQDELKKVISQAMSTNSELEQESIAPFNGELSDEDLEAVAGGLSIICRQQTLSWPCKFNTQIKTWGFFCPRY